MAIIALPPKVESRGPALSSPSFSSPSKSSRVSLLEPQLFKVEQHHFHHHQYHHGYHCSSHNYSKS
ncbi:unnamed protein product, partial [Rotaria magnacalcarata]